MVWNTLKIFQKISCTRDKIPTTAFPKLALSLELCMHLMASPNNVTIYSFMVVGFLSGCFTTHCLFSFSAPGVNNFTSVISTYSISITPSSISGNKNCISALTSKLKVCFLLSLHNSKQVYSWMHYYSQADNSEKNPCSRPPPRFNQTLVMTFLWDKCGGGLGMHDVAERRESE